MCVRFLVFLISAILLYGCGDPELGRAPAPEMYKEVVESWNQDRIESLKEPDGWLRLMGVFWLEEGENRFGSGEENDLIFPEGTIPEYAGTIIYQNGQVVMNTADNVPVTHDGEPVSEIMLYDGSDAPRAEYGSLEWFVIVRGDMTGIRLYDKENARADAFDGFPAYPVDPEYRREARFIPNPEETTISIVNVLGQQIDAPSPGVIEFTIEEETFTLDALEGGERLFIIVGDETNRTETYQAGRYIYIDYPEEDSDYTVIDFNKMYNPPCSFNMFTTCQLPPLRNRLDVAIPAGEKRPVDWVGLDITPNG
ncbi:MAG: DUF1684 domain-containing protein [Balneolaceae bacterium]|nr:DUF1684 domain-containing protein [Balneolaceae bacterium]